MSGVFLLVLGLESIVWPDCVVGTDAVVAVSTAAEGV